jgi:hypothetical protein
MRICSGGRLDISRDGLSDWSAPGCSSESVDHGQPGVTTLEHPVCCSCNDP